MLIGAAVLGVAAFARESPACVVWTTTAALSVLYLALAGTVLTFGVYLWLLRFVPAYQLSLTSFVIPVVALLLGAAVGGEPVGGRTMFGTALVLAGVGLVLARTPAYPR